MHKLKVGILAGGPSSEHEISCISAGGILGAIDHNLYEPTLIGIKKNGDWVIPAPDQILEIQNGVLPEISSGRVLGIAEIITELHLDVMFPILHGPFGEDGTVQAIFESMGIPYVGSGVLASSLAMDKSRSKIIFTSHKLKVADGICVEAVEWDVSQNVDISTLTFPLFVKPARGGSSRGTTKVKNRASLNAAITEAFLFDTKVMIESAVNGREIECGVLQIDGVATASPVGEIIILGDHEFYDFEAKYLDGSTQMMCPAQLPAGVEDEIRACAIRAFNALECKGLARVDFFYSAASEIIINELNTMPGFTPTSVFPKLIAQSGVSYSKLITRLIQSALIN